MSTPNLSISILNSQVKAFRHGRKTAAWEPTQPLSDYTALSAMLRDAVTHTRADRKGVTIVLADPRLSDQLADVPETRGGTLRRLLERQAQRVKAFPEPANWSGQAGFSNKSGKSVLLHLCPKQLLDQISRSCFEA